MGTLTFRQVRFGLSAVTLREGGKPLVNPKPLARS